jgi:DNA-binding NtrC family response regulator
MPYVDNAALAQSTESEVLVPLDEVRRRHVTAVLEACGGNRTNAARVLHVDRKTLYRKLVRWGLASK